ncbi:PspC domain-containing protein [Sunxiuqinia sp. A32]|uniref:PspC domain-containing protein n=1 Tax=Sunxiuqinia sp. A32 TaxID=3461496 RepID=UPI0040463A9A
MTKRLTKSYDRIIAGVCGGISEYINPELDPLITRIAFLVLTFFNPLLLILYLVLAAVMPYPSRTN